MFTSSYKCPKCIKPSLKASVDPDKLYCKKCHTVFTTKEREQEELPTPSPAEEQIPLIEPEVIDRLHLEEGKEWS